MAKRKKSKAKKRKKKGTAKQRKAWAKAGRRLKAWSRKHGGGKKRKKGKAKKAKKKNKKGSRRSGSSSFLGYKAAAKKAAYLREVKAKLEAKGMPPALVKKMMARITRKKTKSTGWFAKHRAGEAAARAQAYMDANYAKGY